MSVNGSSKRLFTDVAVILAGLLIYPLCAAGQGQGSPSGEQQARLEAMQAKGVAASMTVFPVAIAATNKGEKGVEDIGKDAGKVLALLLEQSGIQNLEIGDAAFLLPADVEFDTAGARFGEFVRAEEIETDYALYAEIVAGRGNPPQFDEVRSVVVDKAGETVWIDRQTPDDPDFQRIKPSCLMTSCVLLAERVRIQLGIPESARDDSGEGKIARMLAKDSPGPGKEELAAIEKRQAVMKKAGPSAELAVFPVRLSDDEVGQESAAHLAKLLTKKKLCEAKALDSPLRVKIKRAHDEQKLLWDLARAFRDHVKQNPSEADYALLADYMIGSRSGRVRAVHFVVCDREGEWVIVDFQNDRWDDFQSVDPKTLDDCGTLVARRMKGYLR